MVKNLTTAQKNSFQQDVRTIAYCILFELKSGTSLGFTSHDDDLKIDDINYTSTNSFDVEKLSETIGLKPDSLKGFAAINNDVIKDEDLISGKFDGAKISIFTIDYKNLDAGKLYIKKGYINKITLENGIFTIEIDSYLSKLSNDITQTYSPLCNAKLGDVRCSYALENNVQTGQVTKLMDNRIFESDVTSKPKTFFNYGKIEFTSGENQGVITEVKSYDPGRIELVFSLHNNINIGDEFKIYPGCDKKFSNIENFRGFPFVPGTDKILKGVN